MATFTKTGDTTYEKEEPNPVPVIKTTGTLDALYSYKKTLESQIAVLQQELSKAESDISEVLKIGVIKEADSVSVD